MLDTRPRAMRETSEPMAPSQIHGVRRPKRERKARVADELAFAGPLALESLRVDLDDGAGGGAAEVLRTHDERRLCPVDDELGGVTNRDLGVGQAVSERHKCIDAASGESALSVPAVVDDAGCARSNSGRSDSLRGIA